MARPRDKALWHDRTASQIGRPVSLRAPRAPPRNPSTTDCLGTRHHRTLSQAPTRPIRNLRHMVTSRSRRAVRRRQRRLNCHGRKPDSLPRKTQMCSRTMPARHRRLMANLSHNQITPRSRLIRLRAMQPTRITGITFRRHKQSSRRPMPLHILMLPLSYVAAFRGTASRRIRRPARVLPIPHRNIMHRNCRTHSRGTIHAAMNWVLTRPIHRSSPIR